MHTVDVLSESPKPRSECAKSDALDVADKACGGGLLYGAGDVGIILIVGFFLA